MVFTDLTILFSESNDINPGIADYVPNALFIAYAFSLFSFFKFRIEVAESINFIELLWKIFATGLITTVASSLIKSVDFLVGNTTLMENKLVIDFFYLIHLGLLMAFLISTLVVWKRLILYQRNKILLRTWLIFEYTLYGSLFVGFLPTSITNYLLYGLILLGLYLSVNMKWVAFLSFKQKWKSILLLLLTLVYLVYFFVNINDLRTTNAFLDVASNSIFIRASFLFITVYAAFSLLVILFNLPTSSVFEQKLDEVMNFQRLSQATQTEQSEQQVYEILLESAIRSSRADAGWLESNVVGEDFLISHHIDESNIGNIKAYFKEHKIKGVLDFEEGDRNLKRSGHMAKIKNNHYRSILAFPIMVNHHQAGMLVLLKEVKEGFNKDLMDITNTFVNQAGISVEGFQLMREALENERYKEELNIAKQVQKRLLPEVLATNKDYSISAFSEAADEVGGDYYDTFAISKDKIALIIGDVSGKGTSAAFHMSQIKGIFQSLAQLDLKPSEFLIRANRAISTGLDKTSFVTLSYFVIDKLEKKVEFARAGHCPTLYHQSKQQQTDYFENKGLGLGIVRDETFKDYVHICTSHYASGDIMVLYTDGITEAKNAANDEYGYERLKTIIHTHADETTDDLQKSVIEDLYKFTGDRGLDDDYTIVIVKFN